MKLQHVLLVLLVVSVCLNVALLLRSTTERAPVTMSAKDIEGPKSSPPPPSSSSHPSASLTAWAAAMKPAPSAPQAATPKPVTVDAAMVEDAYRRFVEQKMADDVRRDADGIRGFLIEAATVKPGDIENAEHDARERYADALGLDAADPRVIDLAHVRIAAEKKALADMKPLLEKSPPDWGGALDLVVSLYRAHDAAARSAFGAEAAEELRVSEVDGRVGILAIGAALANRPFDAKEW